jgi:hypothetical protein
MAIEVDTPGKKAYPKNLAEGLGLSPEITARIEQMAGIRPIDRLKEKAEAPPEVGMVFFSLC